MPILQRELSAFAQHLETEDRSPGTVGKYLHDASAFAAWLGSRELDQGAAARWRDHLVRKGCAAATVNSMLSALNCLLKFLGREDCKAKFLRVQRRAAAEGRERLGLLMETICATGIRVSEVRYITVEAARLGRAEVSLKGKVRTILLPAKLCRKLEKYARKNKTVSGEIFLTRNGHPLSRRQIWREMKALCAKAGVEPSKVFPHNLRHLFATVFYRACRDIVKLADVLGHSSINTTRIYLMTTGAEHAKQLERLGLVT